MKHTKPTIIPPVTVTVTGDKRQAKRELARLRVLADPMRYRILALMDERGPLTTIELSRTVGKSRASISYSIVSLRKSGAIRAVEKSAGKVWYAPVPKFFE